MIQPWLFITLRNGLADILEQAWQRFILWLQALPADVDIDDAIDAYDDPDLDQALQAASIQGPLQQAYSSGFISTLAHISAYGGIIAGLQAILSHRQDVGSPVGRPATPRLPLPKEPLYAEMLAPSVTQPLPLMQPQATVDFNIVWGLQNKLAVAYAQQRAAEMVGKRRLPDGSLVDNPSAKWRIDDTTRDRIKDIVNTAFKETKSYRDIKDAIEALPGWNTLFGEYRAEMISRSEIAIAQNMGHAQGYLAQGITHVKVVDGCKYDSACCNLNGTIQTLQWALEHPLSHPNCQRSWLPSMPEKPTQNDVQKLQDFLHWANFWKDGGMTTSLGLTGYELDSEPQCEKCHPCQGKDHCTCQCHNQP